VTVFTAVRVGLAVAVGTEEAKILEPVVGAIAVDVVELHAERLALPRRDPALLAPVRLESFRKLRG
jgi:hypothetical protein